MPPTLDKPIPLAEAKDHLSALTSRSNEAGVPFVITKNGKPWVEVRPLATPAESPTLIHITPTRRSVEIPDLDQLFAGYEGGFVAHEDGFSNPAGQEVI